MFETESRRPRDEPEMQRLTKLRKTDSTASDYFQFPPPSPAPADEFDELTRHAIPPPSPASAAFRPQVEKGVKYIVVSGGVCSSLGKGVATSSIGALLRGHGFRVTAIKLDPYINIDAGLMSPSTHEDSLQQSSLIAWGPAASRTWPRRMPSGETRLV
ncbi:unnamed protein product [Durusdinium trenchii]|uniref:CTP synthase N-terminal domain-containing protein n=1 Tax=Durusdinium trenchii TaxID=1381693 RepID=A0ABP0Q1A4_9DINO